MSRERERGVVAVINTNPDVVQAIRDVLEDEGFETVAAHLHDLKAGRENFPEFVAKHDPAVLVLDVPPPYRENWNFVQLLQNAEAARGRAFVITTTNRRALEHEVGTTGSHELLGKPFDIQQLVDAVRRAAAVDPASHRTTPS